MEATTRRRWRPRVDIERLEILCGERPDLVSPAAIWLVVHSAPFDAPSPHLLSEIYLWAANRPAIAAGINSPIKSVGNQPVLASDAAVFDGYLSHKYRELCRSITSKVVARSQIKRRPRRKSRTE